jgi:hypothetical protein
MNNVHVLQLAEYQQPVLTENSRDAWVGWGEENNYFNYLIERYTKSTTNNAIINNVARLIYGKGLSATDASRKPNEYAQMMALFGKDCVRKMVFDRKLFGQFAIQVHYSDKHDKILKVYHIPVNLLRAEKCNDKGEITGYYYSDNWEEVRKFPPKRIPAFGYSKEKIEIMFVKPYGVGMKYYAYPDYQGALPYAVLEEEVSDYLINEVQNGFSGTKVVNFNNGVPSEEQQDLISHKVLSKLTGSKGQKVIVAFNQNTESKTTVDDIPLNDAPDHYTYLSEECLRKIMLGHNVTSPLLFGIASSNGFSSNADELQNSFILFNNMVIRPFQEEILEAFDRILAFNGIALKLFFRTLKPLEFTDLENAQTEEQVTEETGADATELSSQLDNEIAQKLIDLGEDVPEGWLLIDEKPVNYDTDEEENERLNKEPKKSVFNKLVELVSTGTARPNANSTQDEVIDGIKFFTRYVYAGVMSENSRPFCIKMMSANKIYRKEDIINMEFQVVNEGWGANGADTYSIWLYKGGGNCHHRWNKQLYAQFDSKFGIDINSPNAKQIGQAKASKYGYVISNEPLVSQRPVDMPNYGFLPTNPQPKRKITR